MVTGSDGIVRGSGGRAGLRKRRALPVTMRECARAVRGKKEKRCASKGAERVVVSEDGVEPGLPLSGDFVSQRGAFVRRGL